MESLPLEIPNLEEPMRSQWRSGDVHFGSQSLGSALGAEKSEIAGASHLVQAVALLLSAGGTHSSSKTGSDPPALCKQTRATP